MRRQLITVFVLFFVAFGAQANEFKKAHELFKAGKYKDSLVFLDEVIAAHPDWFHGVYLKGRCQFHLKQYKQAITTFNDALTMEVESNQIPGVKYYIARSYMSMKDYPKAIEMYDAVLVNAPASRKFEILLNKGQSEMEQARKLEKSNKAKAKDYWSKSLKSFGEALKNPARSNDRKVTVSFRKAYSNFKVAELENNTNKLASTRNLIKDVFKLDPANKQAHDLMNSVDFRLIDRAKGDAKVARYKEAIPNLDNYLKHYPDNLQILDKKGKAYQGSKQFEKAIGVFNQLVAKRPDGDSYFSLGSCQMAAKQFTKSIKSFDTAFAKGKKDDASLYIFTAYSYAQQKKGCYNSDIPLYKKAVENLEKGRKLVKGAGLAQLNKDLDAKKTNLETLQNNLQTDNTNHKATIDNINALKQTIAENMKTLAKNKDLLIQQPTDELRAAIKDGETRITEDRSSLEAEYKTLSGLIREAGKCGGAGTFKHYNEMKAAVAQRS